MKYPKHMAIKTFGTGANGFESILWHYFIEGAQETLCGESIDSLPTRRNEPPVKSFEAVMGLREECEACKEIKKKTQQPLSDIMKQLNESLPSIFPNYYGVFPEREK